MGKYVGRRRNVGIAGESSRGVAELQPTFVIPDSNYNLIERVMKARNKGSFGRIEGNLYAEVAKQLAEGDIQFVVEDQSFGLLLKALLGSVNSANHAGETIVKDHSFTVANSNEHQALTVFLDDPALGALAFANGMIDKFDLDIQSDSDEYISVIPGFKTKYPIASSATFSRSAQNLFRSRDVVVKLASNLAGLDAASELNLIGIKLSIGKNLKQCNQLGSEDPEDFANATLEVTGEIKAYLSNSDLLDLMSNGTFKALRIYAERSDITIGSAAHPAFKFDLARVDFDSYKPERKNDDIAIQTLSFKGNYSIADAAMISAVLTNLKASY